MMLRRIPTPLLILLGGALLVWGVATLKPVPKPVAAIPPELLPVAVVLADPKPQSLSVTSQGTVMPRRDIDLVAQVSGRVTQVDESFVDGGFFDRERALVQIDDRDYRLALVSAEARVAEAAQALATERGRVRQARREWRDLGNAEANDLFLRKPQLAAAEAQLAATRADRDQAALNLERTSISAPFAGRVRETHVDLGQYVTVGTRIASVYDSSVAVIRLPLTDRQAALVDLPLGFNTRDKGEKAAPAVLLSGTVAGQRYHWQGHIVRTDASVDTRSRLYYAVAEVVDPYVVNPDQAQVPLVVGLFVEAEISGREIEHVVTLPKSALIKGDKLYTLDEQNRVRQKRVTLLHSDDRKVWVTGEITPGEPVVVGQQGLLSEGLVVTPEPAPLNKLVAGG